MLVDAHTYRGIAIFVSFEDRLIIFIVESFIAILCFQVNPHFSQIHPLIL
jgi:hypothetical protein